MSLIDRLVCFRHVVYSNGSLYFPKVRAADEGSYRCEGLSRSTASQTFTAELFLASECSKNTHTHTFAASCGTKNMS